MEASIGIHYHVILSVTAGIFGLLLIVFVTVLCSCYQKKSSQLLEPQDDGEKQKLLKGEAIETEYRRKRGQAESDIIVNRSASTSNNSDSRRVTSHTTENASPRQTGEPITLPCPQIQPKTHPQQQSSKDNSNEKISIITNVDVIDHEHEMYSQDGSTGAGHHNSVNKEMEINQIQEEIKPKGVTLMPNTRGDHYLTSNDIREVQKQVWEARVKWYNIGIELGIDVNDLKVIKHGANHHDIDNCFTDMLVIWLRQRRPTWEALANALRSEPVGYPQLAE
jgi:hypothetical protein